jgi:succinate dehydrogenase / fumarate reductase cytochrome b subunit
MAITGLAMSLYMVGHLLGNLQIYFNQPQFDAYAHFLTVDMKPLVWVFRIGLLGIILTHIIDSYALLKTNYAARPVAYHSKTWARTKSKKSQKSWASTLMQVSGAIVLFFIIFHIWHFTMKNPVASPSPGYSADGKYQLAALVINEFKNPWVTAIYVGSLLLIGMHLWHGISSAIVTMGGYSPRYQKLVAWFGYGFTIIIVGGFISIPVFVYAGVLGIGGAPTH